MARKIEVKIVGDDDSLHRALGKAQGASSKFGSFLGGAFRVGAVAAGGAVLGLGYALKRGVDEFNSSEKVAAQLHAVLKSTGGAANVTAKHVDNLSTSLSKMSGVDDEVIGAGANILLTFRNIRNEAGKGNDIFDQATKATLDLSVAMGEDLKSATLQVGKALNDPAKGLTALKRVGVQFTDSQTNMIKKLTETGHSMQAQKIILGELTKEFGGQAAAAGSTMAGQMEKLKNAFDEAAGAVIQELLPYVVRLAQFAFPLAVSAITHVADALKNAIHWVARMASHFEILGGKSSSAGSRIQNAWHQVVAFFNQNVLPIIQRLRNIFVQAMTNIGHVVGQKGPELKRIFDRVGAAIKAIAQFALPILRFALVTVLPRAIGIAIDALDKITHGLQVLIGWFHKVSHNSGPSFLDMVGPIQTVISWVNDLIGKIQQLVGWINRIPSVDGGILGHLGIDPTRGLLNQTSMLGAGTQAGGIFGVGGGRAGEINRKLHVHVYLDGKEIHASVKNQDKVFARQNGRSAFA